jgi:putative hemolysin
LRSWFIDRVERLTGRTELEAIYRRLKEESCARSDFFSRALELADISYRLDMTGERQIPASGPLVLVANHPYGVVDGVIFCDLAYRLRGEFRILVNAQLCRDDDLESLFLPIDFNNGKEALATNIRSKRAALATLEQGGVILVFPGGGISTRERRGLGRLADLPWTTFTAKLVAKSQATVVPVFFHGTNSRLFHIASGISPSLRASLLLREARNKMGKRIHVRVGEPIDYAEIAHLDRRALTEALHSSTWGLRHGTV